MTSMDICNPPTPLDDIVIFLRSALERCFAEEGGPFAISTLTATDLAYFFVHTIITHNGFWVPINVQGLRQGSAYPYVDPFSQRDIGYTFSSAPRDSRAFVTLDCLSDGSLSVKGCWRNPGSLDKRDPSLSYEARFNFHLLERSLRLVFGPLLHELNHRFFGGPRPLRRNYLEEELGVLRRFWREVEVNVCHPLRRQW